MCDDLSVIIPREPGTDFQKMRLGILSFFFIFVDKMVEANQGSNSPKKIIFSIRESIKQ